MTSHFGTCWAISSRDQLPAHGRGDELAADAARVRRKMLMIYGAKTKKETVNVALREFAARHRRIAALEHYATLAAGWDFEGWEHRRAAAAPWRPPCAVGRGSAGLRHRGPA
jgi:Arc/MetJ family transcription regulator